MGNKKKLAILGLSGTRKRKLIEQLKNLNPLILDFGEMTEHMIEPGGEGYRQIVNYFGEEFLLKSGKLNKRKLWKFVYEDQNKLRILNFLLEPLLFDQIQKKMDASDQNLNVVLAWGFVDKSLYEEFDWVIWLEADKNDIVTNLEDRKGQIPIVSEKYYDVQSRLFLKPQLANLKTWKAAQRNAFADFVKNLISNG